jgi:ABC-type branched-subunit amino acid transport system substrate-binding protein
MKSRRHITMGALLLTVVLLAAACSNSKSTSGTTTTTAGGPTTTGKPGTFPAVNQPGVTATSITVGGVVSKTNPLGGNYEDTAQGVQAYFNYINSTGGIYGRQLKLGNVRDDALANDQTQFQALVDQDNVFAAMPIAVLAFTGVTVLAKAGMPGFGWNINPEYTLQNNLFAETGSLCWTALCPGHFIPWLAKQAGATKTAVISFSVPQSQNCATAQQASYKKYGGDLVYYNASLQFGISNLASEVTDMKNKGVQFVSTCVDQNTALTLAQEMKKQGLNAVQILPNGYDPTFIEKNKQFFEGSYVSPQFWPFEAKPNPPAMDTYRTWIAKGGFKLEEQTMIGWIDATMFVEGLKGAGPDFTRQKVIDALNAMKADTANGLISPIDWTTQHKDLTNQPQYRSPLECTAIVKIVNGQFENSLTPGNKPFVCFKKDAPTTNNPTYQGAGS